MAARDLSTWDTSGRTSHLRIVLLGGRNSGKSSVGNLILGKEEFVIKERTTCSRRRGVVAGRWLTVVDTPGWWCDFSAQDSAELVKQEIVRSISLCSPGPHILLIVVKMSSAFSGKRQRALEEHLALLGENVWSHSIVLFTASDWPTRAAAEAPVKMGSKALEWLGTKCSQRCHSVIFSRDNVSACVTELLAKIQRLIAENGNRPFVMEESILQAIAGKKMIVEERAQQRFMKMKKQRAVLQEQLHGLLDIRIVLLGAKGSGKSSAVNTMLHREQSLELRGRTAQCVVRSSPVFGRHVTVVDTPGWWMNYFATETPMFDQREIVLSPSLCSPGPHVFLLAIRVDRTFPESYRRAVQEHLELISERMWTHAIVLFNFGDWLGETTIEQYIESEGEPLQWLVEKCSNRYHVLNNKTRGDGFQVRQLMSKIEEMVSGNSGVHYEMECTVIQQLEETMRTDEQRVKERLMVQQNGRQMARSQHEKLNRLPELRMVLVGGRNTGKSSSGNTILGRECFDTENQTTVCDERQGKVSGKTVTVVDTPGWQSMTPDLLRASSAFGLSVILLVVNVSLSFTLSLGEAIAKQLEMLGEETWGRAMVLFSHGDWLGTTTLEQRIESEGDALQRLVERCGNRYHALDNKNWLDGAQVKELLDKAEDMLVEHRLTILQRGVPIGKNITLNHDGLELDGLTHHEGVLRSHSDQLSHNMNKLAPVDVQPASCSGGPDVCGQEVAVLPDTVGARKATASLTIMDRHSFMSSMAAMLRGDEGLRSAKEGIQTLVVNLPEWLSTAAHPHGCMRLSQVSPFLPPRRTNDCSLVLKLPLQRPQTEHKVLGEEREGAVGAHSLCHPTLRERTVKRLATSGGLQALIDQWGTSDLEELEAFIDYYFEMVWEQTMAAEVAEQDCPTADSLQQEEALAEEPGQEVLSSIDKKLSKLDLLEGIQRDMRELKQSLETMRRTTQDLCAKSKLEQEPSAPDTEESKDKD